MSGLSRGSTWSISGLKAGTYRVEFRGTSPYLGEAYNANGDLDATEITIGSDEDSTGYDVVLDLPSAVSGTLTETDGSPIDGRAVIYRRDHGGEWDLAAPAQDTGADGTYSFEGLHPGSYILRFWRSGLRTEYYGDTPNREDAAVIDVGAGERHPGIDASLEPAATLRGTVRDEHHQPVSGAHILIDGVSWAATSADGTYAFTWVQPGTHQIQVQPKPADDLASEFFEDSPTSAGATPVAFDSGSDRTIDFDLGQGAHLAGQVTSSDGQPVAGAVVTVRRPSEPSKKVATVTADDDGRYVVTGLDSEEYVVQVEDAGNLWDTRFSGNAASISEAAPISTSPPATTTEDFVLPARGGITGIVKDEQGNPLAGVKVSAATDNLIAASTTTAADGTYELRLASGTQWKIQFTDFEQKRFPPQFHDDAFTVNEAAQVTVASGEQTVVSSTLRIPRVAPSYARPSITGATAVGVYLIAQGGTWEPAAPALAYQWLRDGNPIIGATDKAYRLTSVDLGKRISLRITASKAGYRSGVVTVETGEFVRMGRFYEATVNLSDTSSVRYGAILSADNATVRYPGAAASYQWMRDGVASPQVDQSVPPTPTADVGHDVSVKASLSAPGHRDTPIVSEATRIYRPSPPPGSPREPCPTVVFGSRSRCGACRRDDTSDGRVRVRTHRIGSTSTVEVLTIKDGHLIVVLDRQRPGRQNYWAEFIGASA